MAKIPAAYTKQVDTDYNNILTRKVLDVLVGRCGSNHIDVTNDFQLLKTLKEEALKEAFQPALDMYEKTLQTTSDSELKNSIANKVKEMTNYIETTYIRTKLYEVKHYFGNPDFLSRADYLYIKGLMEGMKSRTPLEVNVEDVELSKKTYLDSRAKLQGIYGFSDIEMSYIDIFMNQCKRKLYGNFRGYPILLAVFGRQGTGKSSLADSLYRVLNNESMAVTSSIDDILGNFGTLSVGTKVVMKFDEFGKHKKENVDSLKKYIDGGCLTVNRKYRDPVDINVISSFVLTTNIDPILLYGSEKNSRRICVINMDGRKFTATEREIEECIRGMWENCNISDNDNNSLKVLGIDTAAIVLAKADKDTEISFTEWLTGLEPMELADMREIKTSQRCTVTAFMKKFGLVSPTTARIYLKQATYFDEHISGKVVSYTPTDALKHLIDEVYHR